MRILIADEDTGRAARLERLLHTAGHETARARSSAELREHVAAASAQACLIDAHFAGGPDAIAEHGDALPFVVLAPAGSAREALAAARHGAVDVVELPAEPAQLEAALEAARRRRRDARERARARAEALRPVEAFLAGDSPAHARLVERIDRVAATPDTTVLITGERGVRKDVVARAIHARSAHTGGPFVTFDCAGVPPARLAARLFGDGAHGEGALTDAAGGCLLLRRIEALPPEVQARLAAALAERAWRVPETEAPLRLEARLVATSAADLEASVAAGAFREDLFYRLNVLALDVPPLRARRDEIPALARGVLRTLAEAAVPAAGLSPAALAALSDHDWPGNDRELESVVVRAALLAAGGEITPACLGGIATQHDETATLPLGDRSLRAVEEALIRRVLDEEGGNRSRVARLLGIDRTTLYNKLRRYGL